MGQGHLCYEKRKQDMLLYQHFGELREWALTFQLISISGSVSIGWIIYNYAPNYIDFPIKSQPLLFLGLHDPEYVSPCEH